MARSTPPRPDDLGLGGRDHRRPGPPLLPGPHDHRSALAAVPIGDRHPAVAAERLARDLRAGRVLAALVLGEVDEPDDAVDVGGRQAAGDQLVATEVALDVALED